MVTADLTRDYYADLELQAGADTNEIKKQFKKLGMLHGLLPFCGWLTWKIQRSNTTRYDVLVL